MPDDTLQGSLFYYLPELCTLISVKSNRSYSKELTLEYQAEPPKDRGNVPSYLKPKKTIRIAVSDGVLVTDIERRIIDTAAFQRLRGIRQLGLAYLVYPTAVHTRFDHSLGTLHMVESMIQAIRHNAHGDPQERIIDDEQVALARVYALVHDVTHVPFGHSVEDELQLLKRHDENEERINFFLGPESDIGKIIVSSFGADFLTRLLNVYRWDGREETCHCDPSDIFIHDLVSNTVCADLLDYLLRDNLFCNLGVSLEYHFVKYLYLRPDDKGRRRVFVRLWKDDDRGSRPRRDILTDLCRLLETRYLIAERVYFHHAKIAAGAMLGRAIHEAQLVGEITEDSMRLLTDEVLLLQLRGSKSGLCKRLAEEVANRRLYKEVHAFGWEDVQKPQAQYHLANQYDDVVQVRIGGPEERREFENELADIIGGEPGDILIYAPTRKMNRKEAEMNVFWEGHPICFKDIDDPVVKPRLDATLDAHRLLWAIRIFARKSLSSQQKMLAKDICEMELMSHSKEKRTRQHAILSQVVDAAVAEDNRPLPTSGLEYKKKKEKVVSALAMPNHKGDRFSKRLKAALDEEFPAKTK